MVNEGDCSGNCEADSTPALLGLQAIRSFPDFPPVLFIIDREEFTVANSIPLSLPIQNCMQYLAGFCYRKLIRFHSVKERQGMILKCNSCLALADKFGRDTIPFDETEIFLFFKRYDDNSSTLYRANEELFRFVGTILRVANYFFNHYTTIHHVIMSCVESVLANVDPNFLPIFCSKIILGKVTTVMAKTFFLYRMTCLNRALCEKHKSTVGQSDDRVLLKLTHN